MNYKNLYNEHLLDHYNHPANKGTLENAHISSGVYNPSCGDSVSIQAYVKDNVITECKFQATGCVISCAATSMVVDKAIGSSLEQIQSFDKNTILNLIKIELGPTRLRCGLLGLEALHNAIKEHKK